MLELFSKIENFRKTQQNIPNLFLKLIFLIEKNFVLVFWDTKIQDEWFSHKKTRAKWKPWLITVTKMNYWFQKCLWEVQCLDACVWLTKLPEKCMCSSRTHAHIKVVGARTASETNDMTIEDSICELFMSNGHIFAVLFAICVTKEAFHRKTSVSSCVCIVLDFFYTFS